MFFLFSIRPILLVWFILYFQALKAMQESWEEKKFTLVPCKDIKYSTISFPKELQMLLDDQLIKTSTMKSSPFIGTLEAGVIEWDDKLVSINTSTCLLLLEYAL